MALELKEKIVLQTLQGLSEVQLHFGSITSLPVEEKVDAIFVSSFPGDYASTPSSLIGALKRHLMLDVGKLAQDKEVSLLHSFNCWVSKPLPDHMPFRRLVCFERKKSEGLAEQISGIFRAMMPVFNNQDTRVITPLLAAGNQGHSEEMILKSIVTAACHWILAGLPLRCLKIVVYVPDGRTPPKSGVQLITQFQQYKKKWEAKTQKMAAAQKKTYDVCMSYAGEDQGLVSDICSRLQEADSRIVIHKDRFTYDHTAVWQKDIFNVMVNSRRIIAVLTPSYTESVECLDQFNLALCCNRLCGEEALVPFYLQTVPSFPSYMTLIQYTECRARKEGEVREKKILSACTMLVEDLKRDGLEQKQQQQQQQQQQQETEPQAGNKAAFEEVISYDVFISYAHRSPKEAMLMYEALQAADPSLKIFLDRNELRTGNIWQEALYEAVDSARMVVAFVSHSYLQSTVCQEEYNIALARYLSQDGVFFIPILIEDIADIPSLFTLTKLVDLRDPEKREASETYKDLANTFTYYLYFQQVRHNQFCQPPEKMDVVSLLDQWRQHLFHQRFEADKTGTIGLKPHPQSPHSESRSPKTVALSFTNDCLNQASVLSHLLKKQQGGASLTVEMLASQGVQGSKLLDTADMVVVFLSDEYMESAQHRTELHIALCRQRTTKDRPVIYLIEAHHVKTSPVYPRLLPHSIGLRDKHWPTLARNARKLKSKLTFKVQVAGGMTMHVYCTGQEYMALSTTAMDVADKLVSGGADGDSGIPTNIVNLASAVRLGEPGTEPVEQCLVPFSVLGENNPDFVSQRQENQHHLWEALLHTELERQLEGELLRDSEQTKSSACRLL
ncbi:uncharacterized protein LOC143281529 [Babylonia areolata]|uniref:uncharacterized protein LOC143281529 n=1 Tax=Babylonia areolata TaxID=304850 RepID=UPI003FCF6E5C